MNTKRILSIFSMLLIVITACSQSPSSFLIKGQIDGLANEAVLELVESGTHDDMNPIASCTTVDGKFEFKGSVKEPRLFNIRVSGKSEAITVMVENAVITVSATATYAGRACIYSNIKVEGSPIHDLYIKKMSSRSKLDDIYKANQMRHKDILDKLGNARNRNNKALIDSLSNTEASKKLDQDETRFFALCDSISKADIIANKENFWGPFLMLNWFSYFNEELNPIFDSFSPEAKNSYYGQLVKKELCPVGLVVKKVPDLKLDSKNKKSTSITELMNGKKYTLIDFWASWCNPCRKEIPNLKAQYAKYALKGLQIISISIDKKEEDWVKAVGEEKLPWPNYLDNKTTKAAEQYNVRFVPVIFLIDEKGVVISDKLRGNELDDKLGELFK